MKKIYFAPVTKTINLGTEGLIAASGLNNGDNVGNEKPKDDNDENFFTRGQSSIWDGWND